MKLRYGGDLQIGDFIMIANSNHTTFGWYCGRGRGTVQYYHFRVPGERHKTFQEWCSGCHGDNLLGGGEAPALTGAIFNQDWSKQSVGAFNAFIANAMPQGLEGSLKPEEYAVVTAFIMAANGAKPGTAPFTGKSEVKIGAIANGKLVAGVVSGK